MIKLLGNVGMVWHSDVLIELSGPIVLGQTRLLTTQCTFGDRLILSRSQLENVNSL
jgi:hypothetical protein